LRTCFLTVKMTDGISPGPACIVADRVVVPAAHAAVDGPPVAETVVDEPGFARSGTLTVQVAVAPAGTPTAKARATDPGSS